MAKKTTSKAGAKAGGAKGPKSAAEIRIVVFSGKETLLRDEQTAALLEGLRAAHGEVDVFRLSGAETTAADVLDECRSFGLIASHKVVIVDEAESVVNQDWRPMFERYAQNPSEGSTLVLRSGAWRPGNLDKMVAKVGFVDKCDEKKDHEAIVWAGQRAQEKHGVRIERNAATELVDRVGVGLGRIDTELAKLALGAERGVIRLDQVEAMVAPSRELKPWPLQEALLSGSAERGIAYIRKTIESAPRGVEIPLIFAASALARDLHACAVAQKMRIGMDEVARRTDKPSSWGLRSVFPVARGIPPTETARLLEACVRADAGSKSGLGEADRSLEMLAVRFAGVMR